MASAGSIPTGGASLMDPTRETVEVLVRGLSSTGSGVAADAGLSDSKLIWLSLSLDHLDEV